MAYAPSIPSFGGLTVNRATAAGATAFATMVRPYTPDGLPVQSGQKAPGRIHVTSLLYESPAARHNIAIMRPLNFTTFSAAAAGGQAVVNIAADPGNYAINYKYPVPAGWVQRTANNLIAGNDYAMYQCPDGTWVLDTVASVSTLAITMTSNLPTGGLAAGARVWQMKAFGSTDPYTGEANYYLSPTVSAITNLSDIENGLISSHVKYAPILLYNANATAASIANLVEWTYSSIG